MYTANDTPTRERAARNAQPRRDLIRAAMGVMGTLAPRLAGAVAFSMMVKPRRRQRRHKLMTAGLMPVRLGHQRRVLQGYRWPGDRRLLLVHGWDSDSSDFATLIPRLQRAGWGGLTYDAPAHGLSGGDQTDFLDMGDAFRAILDSQGPFDGVLAHSFGSAVALYQLSQYNGRTPPLVVSGGAPNSLIQVFQIYFERYRLTQPVRRDLFRRIEKRLGRPPQSISITGATAELSAHLLILHDRDDPLIPFETGERMRHAAPEAHFLPTRGLGHRGWLRDGDVHERILAFLRGDKGWIAQH